MLHSPSSYLKSPCSNLNSPSSTLLPPSSLKIMGYLTQKVLKIVWFPTKCRQAPLAPLAAFSRSARQPMQHILGNMQTPTKIYQKEVNCLSGILNLDLNCRKKTFDRRRYLMEAYLLWKTNLYWNEPLMEDDIWLRMTFDKDNLWKKTPFNGKRPFIEDDLWFETTLDRW